MNVLFLDIDGVLNSKDFCDVSRSGPIHRDKMLLIRDVLLATDSMCVLSSAWRYLVHRGDCTVKGLEWLLRSHGFPARRLLDVTGKDSLHRLEFDGNATEWPIVPERGQQISDWLRNASVTRYAVVDDVDMGITAAGHPLVLTDGAVGITQQDADRLRSMLS